MEKEEFQEFVKTQYEKAFQNLRSSEKGFMNLLNNMFYRISRSEYKNEPIKPSNTIAFKWGNETRVLKEIRYDPLLLDISMEYQHYLFVVFAESHGVVEKMEVSDVVNCDPWNALRLVGTLGEHIRKHEN